MMHFITSELVMNSLVTGTRNIRNDNEDHKICMVITLIVVEASKA